MDICFEGIGQVVATFRVKDGENVQAGMAVSLTDNGEVGMSGKEDSSPLCGVTVGAVRNGAVAVQIGGVVKVSCSDDELELGWQELVCDGDGGVKTADETGGMKFLVLAVDEAEPEGGGMSKKSVVVKL